MLGKFQNWLTYMLQHWNSCKPESAMTRTIYHVSASESIPINFQVFSMSIELALNRPVANGQRVLLILGQYDALKFAHSAICQHARIIIIQSVALKYMKIWWFTIAMRTEFASILSTWFSLQIYATCSVQPCLLLTHAYQLSVLAPTVFSLAWGNLAYRCVELSAN
jgi:hypothetical protein